MVGKGIAFPKPMEDLFSHIKDELYIALTKLGADKKLLNIVRNWREELRDQEVLKLLEELNIEKVNAEK